MKEQEWGMPTIDEVETEGEAREVAVNWQYFASQSDMSYEELAGYQDYFRELANKFGLEEELKENGLI
jgi:hypothetical protein